MFTATTPALAEWEMYSQNDDALYYVDSKTIHDSGRFRRAWTLMDRNVPAPGGALSQLILFEFDCGGQRARFVSLTSRSGHMAKGKTLAADAFPHEWIYVSPRSTSALTLRYVCQ